MKIKIVATTDIGNHREQNEDAFTLCPDLTKPNWDQKEALSNYGDYGTLLIVADGMGGANAGEEASLTAIKTMQERFSSVNLSTIVQSEEQLIDFLSKSIEAADDALNELMIQKPETYGMGTTIVVCWLLKRKAYIAWCGDSRCYVYNETNGLKALTKDHSYVQELIDRGELTDEEAFDHPENSAITRGLGGFDTRAVPETVTYDIDPNDIFLLCSDGLCGYCNNSTIEKIIRSNRRNVSRCQDELLKAALTSGGEDNITIILASFYEPPLKRLLSNLFKKHTIS